MNGYVESYNIKDLAEIIGHIKKSDKKAIFYYIEIFKKMYPDKIEEIDDKIIKNKKYSGKNIWRIPESLFPTKNICITNIIKNICNKINSKIDRESQLLTNMTNKKLLFRTAVIDFSNCIITEQQLKDCFEKYFLNSKWIGKAKKIELVLNETGLCIGDVKKIVSRFDIIRFNRDPKCKKIKIIY